MKVYFIIVVKMLFDVSSIVLRNFLIFTGLYVILIWMYENLKSPLQILYHTIKPIFVPSERKTIVERYGKWAGK